MKQRWSRGLLLAAILVSFDIAHADDAIVGDDGLRPLITTSELVVGQNRFAFGLLKSGRLLEHADVTLRLYTIDGQEAQFAAESKPAYQPIEFTEGRQSVHRHPDGTQHLHGVGDSDVRGLYITQLSFERPGMWGIEVLARQGKGSFETARFTVTVVEASDTPALGSPAPRSRNLIASDVKDLRQIDTSPQPDVRLHRVRIADAILQGKPQVIVFATPQFCTSRMCGPVVDIVKALLPAYGKRIVFTHQEIWQDFALKQPFPTVEEWRLRSEPWVFVVDGQGIIRAKFEGLMTMRELDSALKEVLKVRPSRPQ
ncbi:MAG TPA: hypothetical protein VE689_07305 [Candidatus Udaeobacter sp.]|nr:hypothetical protein [Candidatus Udaeobacter sp.]